MNIKFLLIMSVSLMARLAYSMEPNNSDNTKSKMSLQNLLTTEQDPSTESIKDFIQSGYAKNYLDKLIQKKAWVYKAKIAANMTTFKRHILQENRSVQEVPSKQILFYGATRFEPIGAAQDESNIG